MGFAPDLDEDEEDAAASQALFGDAPAPGEPAAPRRPARRRTSYPLAEQALQRLLGEPVANAPRPGDDGEAFTVGPDIMRPPPEVAVPSAPAGDKGEEGEEGDERSRTDELMEDMVDMMLVGDDDGQHTVHLAFKDHVFGGLYLKLERTPDGLHATFLVGDDIDRRGVEGQVDALLARLRDRGMRIAGHSVEVRD
jgi:hypothetical protein